MIGTLIRLGVVAIFCIVVYNYFFGDSSEKANSSRIFSGVGTLFHDVKDLVSSERTKFDAGKYNSALDKMGNVIDKLKDHANSTNDQTMQRQIGQLEQKKNQLQNRVQSDQSAGYGDNGTKQPVEQQKEAVNLNQQLEKLMNDAQILVNKAAPQNQNQ